MSKKTRAQKLRSQERKRKLLLAQTMHTSVPASKTKVSVKTTPSPTPPVLKQKVARVLTKEEEEARKYFFQDFRKSALLVACVIALEIAVYYGTMNSYLARLIGFGR